MQRQLTQKTRSRRNHPTIKTVAVILIVACFFVLPVFADETTATSLAGFKDSLHNIISFLSRGWMVIAMLAGKLMTNDRVYGSAMHMDIYLWKIWNVIKNFANFALVAIVIGSIIKNLFGKGTVKIKDVIVKTLVAGVLIQASWFIVGALVDISTVAVSAVGALPSNFIQGNADRKDGIQSDIDKSMSKQTFIIDLKNNTTNLETSKNTSSSAGIDAILPNSNTISGPLVFLGMSAFRFQDYLLADTSDTTKSILIDFSIKTLILFFYSLGLLLIFVANLVRVVFLWLFIIASPAVVLIALFKGDKMDGGGGSSNKLLSYFNFSTMIKLIFKPVMLIATMSFILVFIVAIQNIMKGVDGEALNGVSITANNTSSTLAVQDLSTMTINSDSFSKLGDASKSIFANIIIFLLAIFLIRELVKQSLSGAGPVGDVMKPITGWLQGLAKSTPIFGGFSYGSATGAFTGIKKKGQESIGINDEGKFQKNTDKYAERLDDFFGTEKSRGHENYEDLHNTVIRGGDFFAKAIEIGEKKNGIKLTDPKIKESLVLWLKKNKWSAPGGEDAFKEGDTFESYFGKTTDTDSKFKYRRRALHEALGGNDLDNQTENWNKTDSLPYDKLESNIYHQKLKGQ